MKFVPQSDTEEDENINPFSKKKQGPSTKNGEALGSACSHAAGS